MRDAARLEAHVIAHAGHRAEDQGRWVDHLIGAWIGLASLWIGGANWQYRAAGGPAARSRRRSRRAAGPGRRPGDEPLRHPPGRPPPLGQANAEAATDQLCTCGAGRRTGQGVIVPDQPVGAVAGGELVDWETFLELPPSVRQETLNHLEETTGPAA